MFLLAIVLLAIALFGVIALRAARFGGLIEPVPPAPLPPIDGRAAAVRLGEALRCPTISWPEGEKFDANAFDDLRLVLESNFPRVHAVLTRETVAGLSLLYTWPGSDPQGAPILLMAHQDVVPIAPGTEKDWTHPPFAGEIAHGYIWGRGALDVKSSLTATLEAIEILLADGFRPSRTVYLAFGHDEEVGGSGNRRIAELLDSSGVRLEFILDEGGTVLAGAVPGLAGAAALIGIAEKGYLNLRLTARGEGGHSSIPPRPSAVGVLARAVCRLERGRFPARLDFAAGMLQHLGPALSWPMRAVFANLWLFSPLASRLLARSPKSDAGIRTTMAPTLMQAGIKENVLPQEAVANINLRLLPGDSVAFAVERVRALIDDRRVQVDLASVHSEASPVSRIDSPAFALLRRTILQTAGATPVTVAPYLVVGATDARHFAGLSPDVYRFGFLRLDGADLKRIHGTDERLSLANYEEMIGFYYRLLVNLM